jgi:hypothetical protein
MLYRVAPVPGSRMEPLDWYLWRNPIWSIELTEMADLSAGLVYFFSQTALSNNSHPPIQLLSRERKNKQHLKTITHTFNQHSSHQNSNLKLLNSETSKYWNDYLLYVALLCVWWHISCIHY